MVSCKVLLERNDEEEYYTAIVPALLGVSAYAMTSFRNGEKEGLDKPILSEYIE